jgi:predicted nucleic acid-binding Zn ribbon protein
VRRRRAPRSLAAALGTALERAEPATLLAAVQRAWPDAVGEAIAREAIPVSERDGVVTVACRSSTWAQELDLLSDQILVRIREKQGLEGTLKGLRFNASGDLSENLA